MSNLLVGWSGKNSKKLKEKPIEEGCINFVGVPEYWKDKMIVGNMEHFVFLDDDPPPYGDPDATEAAAEAEESGDGGDDEGEEEEAPPFDPLSMEQVAMRCSDFKAVKSMLQTLIEEAGHKLQLSPKYHAELAGQGIEYDFGRCKWWFRKHKSGSTKGLRVKSKQSFHRNVVTIRLTRRNARRARDYMRAYSWGHKGLEVEAAVKNYKCHRAAIDQDFKFSTGEASDTDIEGSSNSDSDD